MDQLINNGWKFIKLPIGSTLDQAMKEELWTDVDLPHDWLIWQADNLYESADAWYIRKLNMPDNLPPVCIIHFDGVYMDCDVLLNGKIICSHPYGYTAFYADLTKDIQPGLNDLIVHIRHRSPNSRWYSGCGIFRDVSLITLPLNHIIPSSFYVIEKKGEGETWNVRISAETSGTDHVLFSCQILDSNDQPVAMGHTESRAGKIEINLDIPHAKCWSMEHPKLYTISYQYEKQTGVFKIGLRSVCFDPDNGFFLNGEHSKLTGVCLHHDLGALGSAFHEKAAKRQLNLMKNMGVNALRTSHNPPAEKLLDLCDEMGILVVDEAFDMWERPKTEFDYARFFPEYAVSDVASWVRRDRCHPSVIMWSIGNEIYDMHADRRGAEVTQMLKTEVEKHDPLKHAVVTFGCNYMPWEGGQRCADIVKIAGYNYGEKYYEEHHRKHPYWVIYGSETGSILASRNIYHFPAEKSIMSEADQQCSALGNSNTSWGAEDFRTLIVDDLNCSYSMGQFIWCGIDYIGEPTPYHTRSCYFGQADTACFPKDSYFLFRSLWSNQPTLHIGVYWDWNPGQIIDVPIMTNCHEAEVFLNGKSQGRKKISLQHADQCLPVWKIPYEPGELKAVGYNSHGQIVLTETKWTPEDTAYLKLESENESILADGYDLVFVTVSAMDRNGHPVDNARDRVYITVTGGGCLMGTDNGDSTDPDGYKSANRRLFGGKLLLIIGSTGTDEDVCIRVKNNEGKISERSIPARPAAPVQGASRMMRIAEEEKGYSIPIRKIEIAAEESTILTNEHPSCCFAWQYYPRNAGKPDIQWQVTNSAGIETPYASMKLDDDHIIVTACGDGDFYLRAMTGSNHDHPDIISQIEIRASGIGQPALNPYEFVSAGLYDISKGDIGTGNEKGIAFSRDGESIAGFSRVDFGKTGSDCLTLPIFALNGDPYEIDLFDGIPDEGGRLIQTLHYEKPSIWNVYQEETYHLAERLTGVHTICFRMRDKVHMKGFCFHKQSGAYLYHHAAEADAAYGDSFRKEREKICNIGNNVTLTFENLDFGDAEQSILEIAGHTPLTVNAITIRLNGINGKSITEIADFTGSGGRTQRFRISVPGGNCSISFVFLPGSQFDFDGFRFEKLDSSDIIS